MRRMGKKRPTRQPKHARRNRTPRHEPHGQDYTARWGFQEAPVRPFLMPPQRGMPARPSVAMLDARRVRESAAAGTTALTCAVLAAGYAVCAAGFALRYGVWPW